MNIKKRLFLQNDPYDRSQSDLFLSCVKENIAYQIENCREYAEILDDFDFTIDQIDSEKDLWKIPMLPSLFFKNNDIYSVKNDKKGTIKATSSGTQGSKSNILIDREALILGIRMMFKFFKFHRLLSSVPTNYIVLGYQPSRHLNLGAAKTAYGTTFFAPPLHRVYALKDTGNSYEINVSGIKKALLAYSKVGLPVRFVGFPAYMYFLVSELKKNDIKLKLNKRSKVLLGGGWKQFSNEKIDEEEFYSLIQETLGIKRDNCYEFFSAVEHPIPYCKCKNENFHIPAYSKVIVRDVKTLKPIENGKKGILNFITPLVKSMPLVSVATDDIAELYETRECGCGIASPYFKLFGRAGIGKVKTCAASAAEFLGGNKDESV